MKHIGDDTLIEELKLPEGLRRSLKSNGINTVGELIQNTPEQLKKFPLIADKAIDRIERTLGEYGYKLNSEQKEEATDNKNLDINCLGLTQRKVEILRSNGINTIGDFQHITLKELSELRSFGEQTIDKLTAEVQAYGGAFQTETKEDEIEEDPMDVLDIRVLGSALPYKVKRVLEDAGIETLGEFLRMSRGAFLASEEVFKSACIAMEKEYGYSLITGRPIGDTDILNWKVGTLEEFGVPKRATTALENASIGTIQELIQLTQSELEKIRGIGKPVAQELINILRSKGLELREEVVEEPKGGSTLATAFGTKIGLKYQEEELARKAREAGRLATSLDFGKAK